MSDRLNESVTPALHKERRENPSFSNPDAIEGMPCPSFRGHRKGKPRHIECMQENVSK